MPKQKVDPVHDKKESDYDKALKKWQGSKTKADKDAVDALADDLRASRKAFREAGEADGTRQFISIQEGV